MQEDLKSVVRDKYDEIARSSKQSSCCSEELSCCFNESYDQLEGYVPDADLNLGCGLPTELARIQPGQTVLDLGSGAGNDVFVARQLTGDNGTVIGVDFTEAMIDKAEQNRQKLGFENVRFVYGDIEDLPLEDNCTDVVISNCVMNLLPNKTRGYAEVFRVLQPGGHFSISDIVIVGDLPPKVKQTAEMYAGCVAGAIDKEAYLDILRQTGFTNIRIDRERLIDLPESFLLQHLEEAEVKSFLESDSRIYSINFYAEKPG